MIKIDKNCTACMACYNICPIGAIYITKDNNGFVYPEVNTEKCVHCGKCDSVCPQNGGKAYSGVLRAVCLQHNDNDILNKSSSGGAIYALSQIILEKGGIVFGCAFDLKKQAFICTDSDTVTLNELLRSKYVESYIGDSFKKVEKFLSNKRWVLFCGTPCQIAGLKNYLNRDYPTLITVDFTCGGVPSQKYLKEHIEKLENKYKGKVVSLNFRDKRFGWGRYCLTVTFDNDKEYSSIAENDAYLWSFLHTNAIKRDNCMNCIYQSEHCADIVVADFWKYLSFEGIKNDKRGLSLVLVQSDKGKELLSSAKDCFVIDVDIEAAKYNLYNRFFDSKKEKMIFYDKRILHEKGLVAFYKKKFGLKNIVKYRFRQILLEMRRKK